MGNLTEYEYESDPDGDGTVSSADPAVWTFTVDEVFKGAATETQFVVSAVDGSSCGLEIPHQGSFLVFASRESVGESFELAPGALTANLCGGAPPDSAG